MTAVEPVVAVVVAWNGGEVLDRCMESLKDDHRGEIILVDNGSSAAEWDRLRRCHAGAGRTRLLRLGENLGFAAGANRGIEVALSGGAGRIFLVTQDVVLEPGAVGALEASLGSVPDVGIAGPVVVDACAPGRELSRGERLLLPWICFPRTVLRYRRRSASPFAVSGLVGCALMLSRRCLEATGGFDASFIAYYEEVDLCIRARRLGFRIVCVPAARVRHRGWRGFGSGFTALSAELKARNLIRLVWKLGKRRDRALFVPLYASLILGSGVIYGLRGRSDIVRAMARGVRAGWRSRLTAADGV